MLKALPKTPHRVFPGPLRHFRRSFRRQWKGIAHELQNPRVNNITFRTFHHLKATMEYHKTRDILHVMQILGHRNIKNTLIYTQLMGFKDDEYTAKVAHSEKEVCQLVEAGFEYVCDHDGNKIFKKRK
jgi:integrase